MRQILKEAFRLFRNIDLKEEKLMELENEVFCNSFIVSPRAAARQILEIMDASFDEDFFTRQTTRINESLE